MATKLDRLERLNATFSEALGEEFNARPAIKYGRPWARTSRADMLDGIALLRAVRLAISFAKIEAHDRGSSW